MKKHLFFFVMAVLFLLPVGLRAQALTIDFETADFSQHPFTQGASYPWIIVDASNGCDNGSSYCMRSGNAGVGNSSSSIQATYTFSNDGYIVFDAKCMGETAFDIGKFYIDGTQQFYKDISAWEHYMFNVTAGTHTFKWEYTKDAVQSNYGDGFFVDNIEFGLGVPCFLANKLVAYSAIDGSATVSWQGNNNSYTLRYKPEGSGSWTTVTGITGQSHTITGLAPGNYDVEVSADCNPGNWISTSFSILTVQSTANWYGYANAYIDWEGWYTWGEKFVSFSMQNPTNLIASSDQITTLPQGFPYTYAVTYADGYVWCITDDDNLVRAVLDNDNRTISNIDTIKIGFAMSNTMCYNPADGKIYYIDWDNYGKSRLHSFYPSNPEGTVTTIGVLNYFHQALAINRYGEAYCIKDETDTLYQLDLTNASTTPIGSTGITANGGLYLQGLAFDLQTDELFFSQNIDDQHYGLFKMDPATAKFCFIGRAGGEHGAGFSSMFMISNIATTCPAPTGLTVSNVSDNSAKVSWSQPGGGNEWVVEYGPNPDFSSSATITSTDTSLLLSGLTPGTTYYVRVANDCGSQGTSTVSTTVSFTTTVLFEPDNVVIGFANGSNYELPTNTSCQYFLSEQIYTASEIGRAGEINSIAFLNEWATVTRNIDLYLAHTDKSSFSGSNDWTTVTSADLLFSGNLEFVGGGWTVIDLSAPFVYNGTDNLLVVVNDKTGSWEAGRAFRACYGPSQALSICRTTGNPGPNPNTDGELTNFKSVVALEFVPTDCLAPTNLNVSNVGTNVADLAWTQPGDGNEWTVQYSMNPYFATPIEEIVFGTSCELNNLNSGTTYYVRVANNCGSQGLSSWSNTVSFTTTGTPTSCPVPTNFHVASTHQNTATLTWEGSALSFIVEYKKASDTQWQQASTANNTITLSGLDYTTYQVRVQAVCVPGVSESDWATASFTLVDIQSSANWYAYVLSASADHPEWDHRFISFSMQNLNTADTASDLIFDYPMGITYANGYVWSCFYDYNSSNINLLRAPLHNDTKTIGHYVTVKENFETDYISSMAYNPVDGRLYYLRGDQKLFSFDPSNPNVVTEIGVYTEDFDKIAINGSGEAFCYDFYTENLYRINLTDASTTLVGNTGDIANIAFDQNTDELFSIVYTSNGGLKLYLIDPATAAMQEIGYIGGDSIAMINTIFMVGNTANVCYEPENLAFTSVGTHAATVSWNAGSNADGWVVEYATVSDFSNATTVTATTNSYSLTGLTEGTVYYVRVKTLCGANSESNWTNGSFHTDFCPAYDKCNITYELEDSNNDGWNGSAINVVDVATDIVIATLTMYDGSTLSGTLPVCNGREIRFEWVSGYYDYETSYTIYDANGSSIFSGSDAMTAPVLYTMNCPALPDLISIGTCTSGNENLPSNGFYKFGLSQQIYTAAEISRAGTISSISFYNSGDAQTRNYNLYLIHTNKSSFNSDHDWVPATITNLVFSGDVELRTDEWTTIELDVPFTYDGTSNLLLVMDDNTNSWYNSMSCNTFTTTDPQALFVVNDNTNYNLATPNEYYGTTLSEKNCIQLNFATVCPKPKSLAVSTNHNEITLTWTSNATAFNVEYKKTTDTQWQQTSTTGNTITLSGLDYTAYEVRVQAVCDPGVSESDWVGTTVKLFDLQSTANWYSFVLSCSEHPDWMYKYITFSMQNLANADTASESFYNYPTASTYANGYVWAIFTDYSLSTYHLIRAPLDNVNKTIGSFETAMTDFDTVYIPSMAFNPNDARIYYVSGDSKLKSFDPSHPDQVTEIGSYTQDFMSIAINSTGNAYCIDQNYDLYTIDLTDASVSLVGNAPDVEVLAFDLETDEFYGVALSGYGRILCTIDPATAAKEELEYVGGASTIYITSIFMASSSANICYAPANVSVNSIGLHNATIGWDAGSNANSWVVEYATLDDFSNATTVNVTTNSYSLSGLTEGTVYYVRVKADCGADGESYWTVRSFNTHFCESANQCEISYELADSYGDGWNSGAINVVDVASNVVVGTLTMFGGSSLSGTLPVCNGREIRFEWVNGNFDYETSYTVYDANGDTIFSGSDAMSAPVPYTVNCPMSPGLISIGSCTSGSEYLPGSSYYNFNISQQIYTAAEIGQAGTISSVSFYNDGYTRTRTYDMYLVHTNKSAFSNGGDWVPVTAGDLVFSGSVSMEAGEWTAIDLDAPFQYNGTDNLLLVMDDNTGSLSQGMSDYTFNTTDLQALYNHDDYTNYDPSAPSYTGYPVAYKNCIRLNFGAVCSRPKNLTHTVSNQNNVTLTWESNATSFNVNYKKATDTQWQQLTTTTNTVTLSGLDFSGYEVRVQAVCNPGVLESDWTSTSFALFNLQSTGNWYGFVQYSMDNFDWMGKYISFSMQDLSSVTIASDHYDVYPGASTYANGYVWMLSYDNSYTNLDLFRAPLDNDNKTIGNYQLVKSGFETTYVSSMSYNPDDGLIYYLRDDQTLVSFDPEDPDIVTVIGSYSQNFDRITINGSGEAYCLDYNGDLYRISTTDASAVFVGNIPNASAIAFDQDNDELYCAVYTNSRQVICSVDPTTAAKQELGYIGGDTTISLTHMFMVGNTGSVCYAPQTITFSAIGLHSATISWDANSNANSWVVEYATASDFSNATTVNVTTNSCPLSGLTEGTVYYVRVKADCGVGGESYWTVRSFTTSFCESANQCEISYELADSWGDGWNGCAINVVDVATNVVVGTLTMDAGDFLSGTMPVCDGREIRFEWVDGIAPSEISYTVNDPEGTVIFSGSDVLSTPVLYTVNCPAVSCPGPTNLAVNSIFENLVTISWTENGSATEWQACINGDETNPVFIYDNPYTLDFLAPETSYSVKVRANCGANGYSTWSDEVTFTTQAPPPYFYIDGDDSICPGQTTTLYVNTNMGINYLWSTGETSQSITVPVGIYSVTVSKNGNTVAYGSFEVKAKKTYDITVTDAVCASSLPYMWNGDPYTASGSYPKTFTAANGCDSVVTLVLTVNPSDNSDFTETACDSYAWEGTTYTQSGDYTKNFTNTNGCDSIVTLHLTINSSENSEFAETACDLFTWEGTTYAQSGNYTKTFTNTSGCDSTVTLHLTVNHPQHQAYTETAYDTYTWANGNGQTYTVSGNYLYSHSDANGCTQVDTLHLTVFYSSANEFSATACESYEWDGIVYTVSGDYPRQYQDIHGADSVVTMHLTINHGTHNVVTETACESYTWHGTEYTTSGTYTHEYNNADGCASADTLKLTVNHPQHQAYTETAYDTYTWANGNGQTYTVSGNYLYSHPDANGCTQVDTLHLTVFYSSANEFSATACESYEWDGIVYTTSGDYPRQYQDIHGADSVVTLHLTINHGTHIVYDITACESFTWYGTEYTTSGTYTHEYTNNDGCASVDTLKLTVNHGTHTVVTETACESFTWYGTEYTTSGTYTHEYTNNDGCASVDTLKLIVNHGTHTVVTETACESFTWYGTEYNTSGTFTHEYVNNDGCASVDTLKLTVNHGTHIVYDITACESFTWYGTEYNTSGTFTHEYNNADGCASVDTLKLTVNYGTHNVVTETACESFTWYDTEYTTSGTFTHEYTNNDGCASVDTLKLTVNHGTHNVVTETACESFTWYGTEYTTSGTYTHEYTNNDGCASVDTLKLTVNHGTHNVVTETACESFTWYGTEYTTSGTFTHEYTNNDGCASVDTLKLTVNHGTHNVVTETACESFTWYGIEYTTSGTFTHEYTNNEGCASVDTLKLTVNHGTHNVVTETACESFTWYGTEYTTSGTFTHQYTNNEGCASVDTLKLTVNHGTHNVVTETACESFTWYGTEYTTSGTFTHEYTNNDGCASVDTLKLTVNHGTHNIVTETACESFTWYGTEYTTSGTFTHEYTNNEGCASVDTLKLTVNHGTHNVVTETACESFTWYGTEYTTSGTFTHEYTNNEGCASVDTLKLTVNHGTHNVVTETACESFTWYGTEYTTSGTFTHEYTNNVGCASVDTLKLTVNHGTHNVVTETACESFTWYGTEYTTSGTYTHEYTNSDGCPSVDTLHLTINFATFATFADTVCGSYTWHGQTYTTSGTYTYNYTNASGCTSVDTLKLTVNPTYNVTDTRSVCPSEMPYTWNGLVFNAAGAQTVTLPTISGCDSVVTMILTVNQTHVSTDNRTICQSELPYTWNGVTFTAAGVQTATLQDANGCDSTVIMTLTVNPTYNITLTHAVCQSELPYTWNGVVFNAAGSQDLTMQTANGCDSLVTLVLTVNPTYNVSDTRSVCPNDMPYTWNGVTFNAAGAQTVTLQTANGCDSVVTMILTVNQTHVTTDSRIICQSELPYTWNGVTFNAAGVQTATLQDANGCDSTVIMTLTVNPTYNIPLTQAVCESELPYTWNGLVFTAAGSQSLNLQDANGCDSIVTMTLTVNYGTHNIETETACESYEWHGVTYTTSGTYTYEYTNANGCASVDTLILTVNHGTHNIETETACESYEWHGATYTTSGTYTYEYNNADGCASVDTLHLTINFAQSAEFAVTTADSCYSWNGHLYCESGDYTQTLTAANGCDSTVTLHLTITVGIDDHNLGASMTVYPNPTNGIVNVQCTMNNVQVGTMEYHVFDAYGKLVDVVGMNANGASEQTAQIDLSGFANGVYFVKAVADGNVVAVRKVVKR